MLIIVYRDGDQHNQEILFPYKKEGKKRKKNLTIPMKGRKGWANRISGKAKKKKKRSNTKGIVNYRFDQPITAIPDTTTYYAIRWDKLCVIFAQCYCLRVKIFKIISQYIKQLQHNCGDSIFIKALFLYFSIQFAFAFVFVYSIYFQSENLQIRN